MGNLSKSSAFALIILVAISSLALLAFKPASAQTIPNPSVPEFTVRYADFSYDVSPTYGIDQYTGKTIIVKMAEHVDNKTIELTVKNQPFTPHNDSSGNPIDLYYNFRFKGSYGSAWSYYPFELSGRSTIEY